MTGVLVLLVALGLASALGLYYRSRNGRVLATATRVREPAPFTADADADGDADGDLRGVLAILGAQAGERATLLQFSTAFCAPCRATRRILTDVAGAVPGVRHVEVDAELHLDVVRRLGVLRTPTTLVLDAQVRETARAAGQPRPAEVLAALGDAVA